MFCKSRHKCFRRQAPELCNGLLWMPSLLEDPQSDKAAYIMVNKMLVWLYVEAEVELRNYLPVLVPITRSNSS